MNFGERFGQGLSYSAFLDKFGSDDHKRKWQAMHEQVRLTDAQVELLKGFTREMKVIVVAGTWCGDCVNQCPIFAHFEAVAPTIKVRYFDRDASPDLAAELSICGAARVPSLLFLSEDDFPCGRAGDRTLSKYRQMAQGLTGAACSTGLVGKSDDLTPKVVQDWLDEFERIQWMLRTSSRLRQKHGD